MDLFIIKNLEKDTRTMLKEIEKENGEIDLLLLQRFYQTHSMLVDLAL